MKINSNFKDLLRLLSDGGVRYLIVGGYAVMKYTEPYSTKDLDIWIEPPEANAERALNALRQFGAVGVTVGDSLNPRPDLPDRRGAGAGRCHECCRGA